MGCMYIPWNTVANSTIHHQEGGVVNMPQKGRKKKMGGRTGKMHAHNEDNTVSVVT